MTPTPEEHDEVLGYLGFDTPITQYNGLVQTPPSSAKESSCMEMALVTQNPESILSQDSPATHLSTNTASADGAGSGSGPSKNKALWPFLVAQGYFMGECVKQKIAKL